MPRSTSRLPRQRYARSRRPPVGTAVELPAQHRRDTVRIDVVLRLRAAGSSRQCGRQARQRKRVMTSRNSLHEADGTHPRHYAT